MSYRFTSAEQQELITARDLWPVDQYSGGNFVVLYRKLSEIMGRHLASDTTLDAITASEMQSAKLWFDVHENGRTMWEATYWPMDKEIKGPDGSVSGIQCETRHDAG